MKRNKLLPFLLICLIVMTFVGVSEAATPIKVKKMAIAYSTTLSSSSNIDWIASHFDVVDCSFNAYLYAKQVKAKNPNILILGYFDAIFQDKTWSDWRTVNSHEDWFVHDIYGNRIERNVYPGQYLMNPNSGWADYLANKIKTTLQQFTCYGGVFLDDSTVNLPECSYTFKTSYSRFQTSILSNWQTYMLKEYYKIKTALGNKIVMPNAWKYTIFCEKVTGVTFWENFLHGRSSPYNKKPTITNTIYAINTLHKQAELGNIIGVNSGCANANSYPSYAKQWQKFTLACFLFTVVNMSKSYYSWQFVNSDSSKGYFPEMDISFGPPVNDYKVLIKNTYVREFKYYYVVANLDSIYSSSFTLLGTTYILQPNCALFIKKI